MWGFYGRKMWGFDVEDQTMLNMPASKWLLSKTLRLVFRVISSFIFIQIQ